MSPTNVCTGGEEAAEDHGGGSEWGGTLHGFGGIYQPDPREGRPDEGQPASRIGRIAPKRTRA